MFAPKPSLYLSRYFITWQALHDWNPISLWLYMVTLLTLTDNSQFSQNCNFPRFL